MMSSARDTSGPKLNGLDRPCLLADPEVESLAEMPTHPAGSHSKETIILYKELIRVRIRVPIFYTVNR